MREIKVDEDVYEHLLKSADEIGETASSILRRLLRLPGTSPRAQPLPHALRRAAAEGEAVQHELAEALASQSFAIQTKAVDKMLYLLKAVQQQQGGKFEQVLQLQGRERVYFAKSKEKIEASGTSTQPRPIGNSGYWVMTNSPTPAKRQLVAGVLRLFGYSQAALIAARAAMR